MKDTETFEEKVSRSLNALSDGAHLLTGDAGRAEALVVSVVVDASRVYGRSEVGEEFEKWIVGRMVKQYVGYLDETGWPEDDPARSPDPFARSTSASESDVDAILQGMNLLEAGDSDRLGHLIRVAMRQLAFPERAVLWLVSVMGFSYADAATTLELSPIELRATLLRARRELQVRLAVALQRELSEAGIAPEVSGRG